MPDTLWNEGLFSSEKGDWGTPPELFEQLNNEFHFTLDVCASEWNAKTPRYFDEATNGLAQSWIGEVCWCNPPYGREVSRWVQKCYEESQKGATVVLLTFARTDTRWFHDWVYGKAEIRFVKGRLKFHRPDGVGGTAPAPSMIAIYRGK